MGKPEDEFWDMLILPFSLFEWRCQEEDCICQPGVQGRNLGCRPI
jgi:hypothetical protein